MYDILTSVVGVPPNDYCALVLYMIAAGVSLLVIYFVPYLFILIANVMRGGR